MSDRSSSLFSPVHIGLGCFFGTPFTSLNMLAQNYKVSNFRRRYIIVTALAYILLIPIFYFVTELLDRIFYRILIFVVAGLMTISAEILQKDLYQKHKKRGGLFKTGWSVFTSIVFNVFILFVFLCIYLVVTDAEL